MQTPVAFIIFNRPDLTAQVFQEIAKARPPKLFVIADGPRPHQLGERDKCLAARAVVEGVDWDCEVVKNYAEVNLGCGVRVASGLRWVFEQTEEAIILEDDCVPHPTFFRFCEELLDRYRDDERVMQISGGNLRSGLKWGPYNYFFFAAQQRLGLGDMAESVAVLRYSGQVVATSARHTLATGDRRRPRSGPVPGGSIRNRQPVGNPLVHLGLPVDICLLDATGTVHPPQFRDDYECRVSGRRDTHAVGGKQIRAHPARRYGVPTTAPAPRDPSRGGR